MKPWLKPWISELKFPIRLFLGLVNSAPGRLRAIHATYIGLGHAFLESVKIHFFLLLFSLAKKTMFRMAFHGKYGNVWNALMSVPEVSYISESELLQ